MNRREQFYRKTVSHWIDKNAKVLVVGGGSADYLVFKSLDFTNVTLTNIDPRNKENDYNPFSYDFQDAENLTYENNSFDFVVVHAALHHCSSPHKALTEMYRVAEKGILVIESRDSFIMKLLVKLGYVMDYELRAVFDNKCLYGGVNGSEIPNFVYRWTENEVEKTINTFMPIGMHQFFYMYANDKDFNKLNFSKLHKIILDFIKVIYRAFIFFFPKQQNLFSILVLKPDLSKQLHPWLKFYNGSIRLKKTYLVKKFE